MVTEKNRREAVFFPTEDEIWEYDETIARRIELHPELSLMFAVLEDAVSSFQKHVSARDEKSRRIFREVEDWILDDRNDEVFSFVSICEHLGMNAKYLRHGLLRWKRKKLAVAGPKHPPAQNPFSLKTGASHADEKVEKQGEAEAKAEREEGPDALTLYLQEVASIPRMTEERESELTRQMKEGRERQAEEVLSSPAALRYALALIDKLRKFDPQEIRAVLEAERKIDPREFSRKTTTLHRLAAAHDRLLAALKKVSLAGRQRERLEQNLSKTKADIFRALKNLPLSGARMEEVAARLKNEYARLTELEKRAEACGGKDRSSIYSEIKAIERELELPREEIKRRARSITENAGEVASARNELIDAHLRLVVRIARKYARLGLPLLDLIQDGNIGLLKAAEKFDPRFGFRFSTYARWCIGSFVREGAIESARIMRVPISVMREWRKVNETRRRLSQRLGREPALREIAAEAGKPLEDVFRIVSAMRKPISLEATVGQEAHLFQFVENRRSPQPFEAAAEAEVCAHVAKCLAALPPREQAVLRARFGMGEANGHTLEEVARRYSVTRERIRQIEHKAFARLRLASRTTVAARPAGR